MYFNLLELAGAELGQAQVKLEDIIEVVVKLGVEANFDWTYLQQTLFLVISSTFLGLDTVAIKLVLDFVCL